MFKRVGTFGRLQLRKCPPKRGEGYQMQLHVRVYYGVRPLKEATMMLNSA